MKTFKICVLTITISILSACVATVGPSISVPKIPPMQESKSNFNGTQVAVGDFKDVRTLDYNSTGQGLVTPEGDVSQSVSSTFKEYLTASGATVSFGAPLVVKGEIREWQSAYQGSTTGALDSVASLYVEVSNAQGTKIFSGNFKGNRSSSFPIVTAEDIKDSLAFALSQAVQQVLNDPGFQRSVR